MSELSLSGDKENHPTEHASPTNLQRSYLRVEHEPNELATIVRAAPEHKAQAPHTDPPFSYLQITSPPLKNPPPPTTYQPQSTKPRINPRTTLRAQSQKWSKCKSSLKNQSTIHHDYHEQPRRIKPRHSQNLPLHPY
ncbi:hypothetical protein V6N11_048133 [Hibiscus sabdariffa]|uniref:Uncharacterized protein n=2 Tax=Hibiscus sabdariffa TaxID=183260 RepID=A0ABR1ZCS0_9ROSI